MHQASILSVDDELIRNKQDDTSIASCYLPQELARLPSLHLMYFPEDATTVRRSIYIEIIYTTYTAVTWPAKCQTASVTKKIENGYIWTCPCIRSPTDIAQ